MSKLEGVSETEAEPKARVQRVRKEVDWEAAKWEEPETDRKSEIGMQGAKDTEEEKKATKYL